MRVSERWLREWVDSPVALPDMAQQLTMAGLEQVSVDAASAPFSGVVVAEVVAVTPHPGADRLTLCTVRAGDGETLSIVCGAPNVVAGLRAPLARVGASLPGGVKIRRSKLRGEMSEGMLCAAAELGLEGPPGELLALPASAVVGQDLRAALGLDDQVLTLDIPPNRGDCLSMLGIAREVAALSRTAMSCPEALADGDGPPGRGTPSVSVALHSPADCPRYLGCVVRGLDTAATSPLWLRERLRRAGLRAIFPVVDITNYVMLLCGQPMHAFDLSRLRGGIVVRPARRGEALTLLNGQEIQCHADDLLIADESRALALAGIMGGADSGVDADSAAVFLESAFFAPAPMAGRARRHGLQTDASHRFERGVDSALPRRAMRYALKLLQDIAGGVAEPIVEAVAADSLPALRSVALEADFVDRALGFALPAAQMSASLSALGFGVEALAERSWRVTAPSWRFDIAAEVDLVEEIIRMRGFQQLPDSPAGLAMPIPATPAPAMPAPAMPAPATPAPAMPAPAMPAMLADAGRRAAERGLRQALAAKGYQEMIGYSLVDPLSHALLHDSPPAAISNPLSGEMGALRAGLWCGLLDAAQRNQNRQCHRLRLFECGRCFALENVGARVVEPHMLAGLATGSRHPESWAHGDEAMDFYDIKADLVALPGLADCVFEPITHRALRTGRAARFLLGGQCVGEVGELHPTWVDRWGLKGPVFVFQMRLERWVAPSTRRTVSLPSRFPAVRRDLALVAPDSLSVAELLAAARAQATPALRELIVMDIYRDAAALGGPQRYGIALGFVFQRMDRTMKEHEIACIIDSIINILQANLNVALRT